MLKKKFQRTMSDDESMGSASEYEYNSEDEDEDSSSRGESKKCSPVQNSKGQPYALLDTEDLTRHKDEVSDTFFSFLLLHFFLFVVHPPLPFVLVVVPVACSLRLPARLASHHLSMFPLVLLFSPPSFFFFFVFLFHSFFFIQLFLVHSKFDGSLVCFKRHCSNIIENESMGLTSRAGHLVSGRGQSSRYRWSPA